MLDDFREWLSDNLRYIILGLAAILLIVIAFFAVKLITGIGSPKEEKKQEAVVDTEAITESQTEGTVKNDLVRNQQDILDIVSSYYTAKVNKDYDTLKNLSETFDETTQAAIDEQDAAIESYSNIMTYSKAGLAEGEYIVFVYCDVKLSGIDTLAPTIKVLYLITGDDGKLSISDIDGHPDRTNLLQEIQTDEYVQALLKDVDQKLENAMSQDEKLKDFLEQSGSGASDGDNANGTGGEDGTGDGGNSTAATGTMQATTAVNVRGEPSADSTLYGSLMEGMTVEVLENLDSGWSKIRYTTGGTTIEGYVMTQYLGAAQ